ncbi:hypothetical protein BH09PAT3_BH09PAT3_4430 [soil metagenome]
MLVASMFIAVISVGSLAIAKATADSNDLSQTNTPMQQKQVVSTPQGSVINKSDLGTGTAPVTPTSATKPIAKKVVPITTAVTAPTVASGAIKGTSLYVSAEYRSAATAAAQNASSSDAQILNRLANKATAKWFGGWSGDIKASVNNYVTGAQNVGQMPTLVAYNIPFRDCGGESAGGVSGAAAYAAWIQSFADGIAGRSAIVILEPDAIAADCFNASRADMLANAIRVLQSSGASVYLDAGNPTWRSAADISNRLKQSGIVSAAGFSLNVSNFQTTLSNINYGSQVSSLVGGKHFVIDTSRSGTGPAGDYGWCNPAGRALGNEPTTQTGYRLVDAYLWIKVPGESDGACGPAIGSSYPPSAGTFWTEYALMLARNAGW